MPDEASAFCYGAALVPRRVVTTMISPVITLPFGVMREPPRVEDARSSRTSATVDA
jgi:hypothetical protein